MAMCCVQQHTDIVRLDSGIEIEALPIGSEAVRRNPGSGLTRIDAPI